MEVYGPGGTAQTWYNSYPRSRHKSGPGGSWRVTTSGIGATLELNGTYGYCVAPLPTPGR